MVCPNGSISISGRGSSPEDVLPMPSLHEKATPEALSALMRSRRSIRKFTEQEIDQEILEQIVIMASTAPMGIPPWDVGCILVRGRYKVQELTKEVMKGYEGMLKNI
jgi:hypothetical protein